MKIIADAHIPYLHDYFGSTGELITHPGRSITASDVHDAEVLLVRSITKVNKELLADSRIRFVGSVTAGADHLDTSWLDANDIAWGVAAGFNAPAVTAYVMTIVQSLPHPPRKAAVIGVGHVGSRVANELQAQNIDVILCDPFRSDIISTHIEAIADVDLITLHVPLTHTGSHPTYHFIHRDFLARQKPGCVLVNTSRGAVIDSDELMQHGKHLPWCFDVWENEPHIRLDILEHAHIATPHIAGYSADSKRRGIEMIYAMACEKMNITRKPVAISAANVSKHIDLMAMTKEMRQTLANAENKGEAFDRLRSHLSDI